jgi:aminopeptidase N
VRAFLKKHEFKNATWTDLVKEFENASNIALQKWAQEWVTQRGLAVFRSKQVKIGNRMEISIEPTDILNEGSVWKLKTVGILRDLTPEEFEISFRASEKVMLGWQQELEFSHGETDYQFLFPNYKDYGYGIFLLDDKSRGYILKNIQIEMDPFLRSMMWGALWDSVRESDLDPKEYVELAIKVQSASFSSSPVGGQRAEARTLNASDDESTTAMILNRVSTAMTYYVGEKDRNAIAPRLESMLIEKMRTAPTLGQRITYYRAFLNIVSSENGRGLLKAMLRQSVPSALAGGSPQADAERGTQNAESDPKSKIQNPKSPDIPLKTKDRFDIVTKLASLNDPDAEKLLAELEKTETTDDAKRYAYAARAAFPTKETKEKYWNDFVGNKQISESWIEAAFGPFNSVRHADLTLPYLERALKELPNHKRNRKIFFVNGWLGAFIGGQRSEQALAIVNKFLADNPNLDRDLRLKILENVDVIERAVKIRGKFATR